MYERMHKRIEDVVGRYQEKLMGRLEDERPFFFSVQTGTVWGKRAMTNESARTPIELPTFFSRLV